MVKECDLKILSELRKNSRQPLTSISRNTNIPVSTIYDRIKTNERNLIKKHTSILDFQRMGYNIRSGILANFENKNGFLEYAKNHKNVNSVFKMEGEYEFMIDCIFIQMSEFQKMMIDLEKFGMRERLSHFITDEIMRENFLGYEQNGMD